MHRHYQNMMQQKTVVIQYFSLPMLSCFLDNRPSFIYTIWIDILHQQRLARSMMSPWSFRIMRFPFGSRTCKTSFFALSFEEFRRRAINWWRAITPTWRTRLTPHAM